MDKLKNFLDKQLENAKAFKDNQEIVILIASQAFGGVMLMYEIYKDTKECSKVCSVLSMWDEYSDKFNQLIDGE